MVHAIDLTEANAALKRRGVRLTLEQRRNALYIPGTMRMPDGCKEKKRIPQDLAATNATLLEAENRIIAIAAAMDQQGVVPDPLPWTTSALPGGTAADTALKVNDAIALLQNSFWEGKPSQRRHSAPGIASQRN